MDDGALTWAVGVLARIYVADLAAILRGEQPTSATDLPSSTGGPRVGVEVSDEGGPARGCAEPIATDTGDPPRHPALSPEPAAPIGDRFQQIEAARLRRTQP